MVESLQHYGLGLVWYKPEFDLKIMVAVGKGRHLALSRGIRAGVA